MWKVTTGSGSSSRDRVLEAHKSNESEGAAPRTLFEHNSELLKDKQYSAVSEARSDDDLVAATEAWIHPQGDSKQHDGPLTQKVRGHREDPDPREIGHVCMGGASMEARLRHGPSRLPLARWRHRPQRRQQHRAVRPQEPRVAAPRSTGRAGVWWGAVGPLPRGMTTSANGSLKLPLGRSRTTGGGGIDGSKSVAAMKSLKARPAAIFRGQGSHLRPSGARRTAPSQGPRVYPGGSQGRSQRLPLGGHGGATMAPSSKSARKTSMG